MTCPFKRCQDQVTHCDGACHGVMPDGTPLVQLPELREDLRGWSCTGLGKEGNGSTQVGAFFDWLNEASFHPYV
jgi:hypothetical protein